MGRAARWLRRLLGGKQRVGVGAGVGVGGGSERKPEKKRWSFGKGGCERGGGVVSVRGKTAEEAAWLSSASSYAEGEKEQSRHAIKVAAATAAAADAAIAAAQAAVVVVRLTSQGRGAMLGVQERLAAVKIQTVFRSYLARKALRALKALVKLQALVRGYLVRKQAATTFQCMQSLMRAQATIRAQRSRRILACDTRLPPRSSLEGLSETPAYIYLRRPSSIDKGTNYNFDRSPKTVEIDTYRPNWQSSRRISPDIADDLPLFTVPSPLNCRLRPTRLAIPELQDSYYDTPHKCRGLSNTTHSTPRYNAAPPTPPTPTKNEPGYMAKTRSFEAKTRSQSAPKQRPETPRKKAEMVVESRASLSGVERCSLSRGVDRSFGLGRESCFERKW